MQVHVSPEVNALLDAAVALSVRRSHYFVGVDHLFDTVLESSALLPRAFAERYLSVLQTASRELERQAWRGSPAWAGREVFYTPRCAQALADAAKFAERQQQAQAGAGHLLLAILADAYAAPSRALDRLELGRGEILAALRNELVGAAAPRGAAAAPSARQATAVTQTATPAESAATPARETPFTLSSVTRDLTDAARRGQLQRAIGRDREMFQVLQILARKNKNNVMLVGEAGVGKTQIVEGLAVAGTRGGMGGLLSDYRILELNLAALMAGTQYRGAFEEKLLALLDEIKRSSNIILFIDEVHLIMGAGSTGGDSMDAANLLKPALARGEIRCIGATTLQEYRKFVEKDPAIERRFQMVRVEPLSESATREVLERLASSLQEHHGVRIGRRAIEAAITLTQRYMPGRHLPDKAIDVLDQACARYRLKTLAAREKSGRFPISGRPSGDGREAGNGEASHFSARVDKVTPHDIRKVVSQITAIPIEEMTAEERLFLNNLERDLNERIIGQDEAVARTVAVVKKARAGLSDPHRPDAVMLFLGPSGVGKTQLAKELAEMLLGSSSHLITFDMSEYMEEHSISRLIGAPPGYVGSEEEGRLIAAVRNAPFSVLLFDEIEKAHRRIFDIFLPIFDEGRLKDSRGREVSFRNCIIILTSNIGARLMEKSGRFPISVGSVDGPVEDGNREASHFSRLMEELRRHFRPEFINRLDEIVPFYPLLFEDIRTILSLVFDEINGRLKEKQIALRVYQRVYEHIARQGYSADFGARELRRTVDRLVVEPISDKILKQEFVAGDTIEVLMDDDALTFRKGAARADERMQAS